jgi:ABC-type lipoprotein export system ATPase subunit
VLALGLAYTPSVARVVRGTVLSLREKEYVEASRVMGNSEGFTMARHILPNCIAPDHRARHIDVRLGAARRERLELSRARRAAAGATWGNMLALEPPPSSRRRSGSGFLPGLCHLADAARHQTCSATRCATGSTPNEGRVMARRAAGRASEILLAVEGLTLEVARSGQRVVQDFSLALKPGEIVGVVGESGSGKTMAARARHRAAAARDPPRRRRGAIRGPRLLRGHAARTPRVRGARIGMVFQEPMTSLNPSMTVGRQIERGSRSTAREQRRAAGGLAKTCSRASASPTRPGRGAYPHQFSGGMRQRIMLASVMLPRAGAAHRRRADDRARRR